MSIAANVVLGACVGDAVGAPLEFIKKRPIPKSLVSHAADMRGGGFLDLAPGQITDDGEMTICLARALQKNTDPMKMYQKWFETNPVDIGITTKQVITTGVPHPTTEANGALMRCSAIPAFYFGTKTLSEIADLARQDARRTHASAVCQEANAVYSVALAHLLIHKNPKDAIEEARRHARGSDGVTVLKWIDEATVDDRELVLECETRDNIGWVRWGLTLAFYHLYHNHGFEEAILDVVARGGDTDTNATITGALLAAYDDIPPKWLSAISACHVRPEWLQPAQFVTSIKQCKN